MPRRVFSNGFENLVNDRYANDLKSLSASYNKRGQAWPVLFRITKSRKCLFLKYQNKKEDDDDGSAYRDVNTI